MAHNPRCTVLVLFCILAFFTCANADKVVTKTPPNTSHETSLDETKIRNSYEEGDFESTLSLIDYFTRTHSVYSKADSIVIAKYLAIIYAANPATREKGKSYMFRLLELMPSASIVDMFVSDEIDRIFQKTREEYVVRQKLLGKPAPSQVESNQFALDQLTMAQEPKRHRKLTVYWIAGGTAVVAATGALMYLLLAEPNAKTSKDITYVVPH